MAAALSDIPVLIDFHKKAISAQDEAMSVTSRSGVDSSETNCPFVTSDLTFGPDPTGGRGSLPGSTATLGLRPHGLSSKEV